MNTSTTEMQTMKAIKTNKAQLKNAMIKFVKNSGGVVNEISAHGDCNNAVFIAATDRRNDTDYSLTFDAMTGSVEIYVMSGVFSRKTKTISTTLPELLEKQAA